MKLLVIGHARHGKDTVCEILRDDFGLKFENSSSFCAKRFIYEKLKKKYGYATYVECFNNRHNHRAEWFNLISDYCKDDPARLGKEIFAENDIYCGLRNKREFEAMQEQSVFDYCIWVDRSDHLPPEPKDSMSLEQWMSDFTIDNNGTINELMFNTYQLIENLKVGRKVALLPT